MASAYVAAPLAIRQSFTVAGGTKWFRFATRQYSGLMVQWILHTPVGSANISFLGSIDPNQQNLFPEDATNPFWSALPLQFDKLPNASVDSDLLPVSVLGLGALLVGVTPLVDIAELSLILAGAEGG
jgi:hypothetical protein